MASVNTFDTYRAEGIREDLADIIYNIAPTDTPFVSNVGSGSAEGTYHEWQKDTLEAPSNTPRSEGADATLNQLNPTVRLANYCQINDRAFAVSGSDRAANNAGRGDELAYQSVKEGYELRKAVEYACINDPRARDAGTGNAGGSPTPRVAANIHSWIATNTSSAAGDGAADTNAPAGDGTDVRTDGSTRAFTEAMLESVVDQCYLSGGNPSMIMTNTAQKRVISKTFKGSTDSREHPTMAKRVIAAVDFYESDYGVMSVVPNRWMRQRDVFLLDPEHWTVNYYRPYFEHDLAKTGDNDKKQMIVEWTLRSNEEASSGGVFDLA